MHCRFALEFMDDGRKQVRYFRTAKARDKFRLMFKHTPGFQALQMWEE